MTKKPSFYKGVGFTVLSATGLSLVGLFGKLGIHDFSIAALMFWRFTSAFSLLFLVLFCLGKLRGIFYFRHMKMQFIRAFFILVSQYCFFYYLMQNNLFNAFALLNTGPIFISIIEWGFLKKRVGVSTWVAAALSFMGALCIAQPDTGILDLTSLIGLTAGICQGASQVVFGIQSEQEVKPYIGVVQLFAICALCSFFPFLLSPMAAIATINFTVWDYSIIIMLATVSIFSQILRALAYSHGTPSRLSVYLYVSVLLAGVWDWVIFKNPLNFLSMIGAALIVLGGVLKMYLRNWILKRKS